jgi:hypothetical protein
MAKSLLGGGRRIEALGIGRIPPSIVMLSEAKHLSLLWQSVKKPIRDSSLRSE